MATLVSGVQYGLSSHSNFNENKTLIFVKLTDSAQRSIEELLKNKSKTGQNPTIQFQGHGGRLSFPSQSGNATNFTFSLSDNGDIEGPQGNFECIHQNSSTNLESLGSLPVKMRIQANEDVYETTRHRMAVAEENSKNKCTRVIKANGPDIGRKVKVKNPVRPVSGRSAPAPSRTASAPSRTVSSKTSAERSPPRRSAPERSAPASSSSNASSRYRDASSASTSSATTNSSSVSHSSSSNNNATNSRLTGSSSKSSVSTSNGTSNASKNQPPVKITELMRRPLKERIIHILALRPFKKPELYERLTRDGIRDKERNVVATVLKQVAYMRDNTYHLHRYVWNDVQEEWPFYTEMEKTQLKRRKPQNLTPPGSSDGSSGSGQSPNSLHPGSPPAISAPPPASTNKRPGYYQGNDGLPTKRPRISHFNKPETSGADNNKRTAGSVTSASGVNCGASTSAPSGYASNLSGNSSNAIASASNSANSGVSNVVSATSSANSANGWLQAQQQPQQQTQQQAQQQTVERKHASRQKKSARPSAKQPTTPNSDNDDIMNAREPTTSSSSNGNSASAQNNPHSSSNGSNSYNSSSSSNRASHHHSHYHHSTKSSVSDHLNSASTVDHNRSSSTVDYNDRRDRNNDRNERSDRRSNKDVRDVDNSNSRVPSSNYYNSNTSVPATVENVPSSDFDSSESPNVSEYPDYLTYYTTISSAEQRRRYKAEFTADYEEYRKLHESITQVSGRFTQLEERLKQEEAKGNWHEYEEIRNLIVSEYTRVKRDPVHHETKNRFHYLHEKLSHIKRLVSEYDSQQQQPNGTMSSGINTNNMSGITMADSMHY